MRKDYRFSKVLLPLAAAFLFTVMVSTSVCGYYSHDAKSVTEWQKVTMTPATVESIFVVPEQRAVVYLVNVNTTSKGVKPVITARCNSPSRPTVTS